MHFILNESAIISARSRKGAEFSGTWLLDPHNLWVYNSSKPAKEELPSDAGSKSYQPGPQEDGSNPLKLAANSTSGVVDSYVTDDFINTKLSTMEVQLTADGNITVTSNVTIKSTSSNKFSMSAAKKTGEESYTGHVRVYNSSIDVQGIFLVIAQGNVSFSNSKVTSKSSLMIASGNQNGSLSITNSNISGVVTSISATKGNIDITGGNVNGSNLVKISTCTTDGNATLSGVSVNSRYVNVTGSSITLDNATLNVSPSRASQGISIGLAPSFPSGSPAAKTVVIKNSTLNTTGSTAGVIKVQGIEEHSSFSFSRPQPPSLLYISLSMNPLSSPLAPAKGLSLVGLGC